MVPFIVVHSGCLPLNVVKYATSATSANLIILTPENMDEKLDELKTVSRRFVPIDWICCFYYIILSLSTFSVLDVKSAPPSRVVYVDLDEILAVKHGKGGKEVIEDLRKVSCSRGIHVLLNTHQKYGLYYQSVFAVANDHCIGSTDTR